MVPSDDYAPVFQPLLRKVELVKLIIEFLLANEYTDPSYEDLLLQIREKGDPQLSEDFLLQNAQFICDHVC